MLGSRMRANSLCMDSALRLGVVRQLSGSTELRRSTAEQVSVAEWRVECCAPAGRFAECWSGFPEFVRWFARKKLLGIVR